jgi:serine/threonine protein phosphatase PrpC
MHTEMAGLTHQGMVRTNNEDSIALYPEMGLAILADGMGGHQAGEVASGAAVEIIHRYFVDKLGNPEIRLDGSNVIESIELANTAVYEMSQQKPEYAGMGTTIVVAYFTDDQVHIGHVGDSRLYRYRAQELEQMTEDHSVVQELVSRGFMSREEANSSMNKNLVTRALGIDSVVNAALTEAASESGDIYLLCSDGLSDIVADDAIRNVLQDQADILDQAAETLVSKANDAGGPDNISVLLARTVD